MALEVTTTIRGSVAEISLVGELGAADAAKFQQELQTVAASRPERLVLRLNALTFLASAGVRTLIFAKQKMGPAVEVYVIAPQPMVLATIARTGLLPSVIVQDEYTAAG